MRDAVANSSYTARFVFDGDGGMRPPDPGSVVFTVYGQDGSTLAGPGSVDPSLAAAIGTAQVRANNGQLQGSADGGETWFNLGSVDGLVSEIEQTDGVVFTDTQGNPLTTVIGR